MPGYPTQGVPIQQQQQHPYYSQPYPAPTHSPVHNPYASQYYPPQQQYGYPQPDNQGRMNHRAPYPQDAHRYNMYSGMYQGMPYPMQHRGYPQPEMPPYGGRMEQPQPQQPQQPMVVSSNHYNQQYTPIARSSPAPPTPRQIAPTFPDRSILTPTSTTPSVRESDSTEEPRRPSQAAVSPVTPSTSASVISASQEPSSIEPILTDSTPAPVSPKAGKRMPFYPPLPWFSNSSADFPQRTRRRRKRRDVVSSQGTLAVPSLASEQQTEPMEHTDKLMETANSTAEGVGVDEESEAAGQAAASHAIQRVDPSEGGTPVTSQDPSEPSSTVPTTPSSSLTPQTLSTHKTSHTRNPTIPAVPLVPIKPAMPMAPRRSSVSTVVSNPSLPQQSASTAPGESAASEDASGHDAQALEAGVPSAETTKALPKSWADLVRPPTSKSATSSSSVASNGAAAINGFTSTKAGSLAEAISTFSVGSETKIPFLKPRGLVNMGNMCYMNSILQILVFCVPFYDFLDRVGKKAAHSFKSETPLLDAMIMFMREFPVIDSAFSVEQLRRRLKEEEHEQYGDAFVPEYVYDTIKRLPRFSTMRRGHQQDAEEFLGFLLEGLHDECAIVLKNIGASGTGSVAPATPSDQAASGGWQEVVPKQKASVTRSSGAVVASPITKIFGGLLRSELKVPGLKPSNTLEPYKPLQLDIGGSNVVNIVDALKGLTRSETITGDFNSPRGPGVNATKQVYIETLPQVLILHLKRFQYDSSGGTQKIYKRVGYPLELEIPKEVFPPAKRNTMLLNNKGVLPKYRLIGVVYHHGKNASGGHYTVDVRRQDGRDWIRMDDTFIRRVRPEDVAEGGVEEVPKLLTKALEQHKLDSPESKASIWDAVSAAEGEDADEEDEAKGGWKDAKTNGKKWSGVAAANGTGSGKNTPVPKEAKDKVAYILFYEEVKP